MSGLLTESGVSAATGEPFVKITWEGPEPAGQLTVAEARDLALVILGAAEAAVTDAALMAWLRDTMHQELPTRVAVLADYRVARRRFDPEA